MGLRQLRSFGLIATVKSVVAFSLTLAVPVGAKTIIKLSSPTIKESVHHWMLEFEKRIEKRAGDRFDVKVFPLSQLGTIEMVMIPPAFMVAIDQRFQALTAPASSRTRPTATARLTIPSSRMRTGHWASPMAPR